MLLFVLVFFFKFGLINNKTPASTDWSWYGLSRGVGASGAVGGLLQMGGRAGGMCCPGEMSWNE